MEDVPIEPIELDQNALSELLSSLPGVDLNNPQISSFLAAAPVSPPASTPEASARELTPAELAAREESTATPNSTMDVFILNAGGLDPNLFVDLTRQATQVPGLCRQSVHD